MCIELEPHQNQNESLIILKLIEIIDIQTDQQINLDKINNKNKFKLKNKIC